MNKIFTFIFVGLSGGIPFTAESFVLLSGPSEAKLDVSPDAPVIDFVVDTDNPKISGKNKFMDGKYKSLSDQDFWLVLVAEAMDRWNNVYGSYVKLRIASEGTPSFDPDDKIHSIVVAEDASFSSAASASPELEDDKIIDCDIKVGKKSAGDSKGLAYTLLHELGHCLGLGHNHSNYDAVMGYSRGSKQLRLGADDKAGIIFLYPDPKVNDEKPKELISCGTVANSTHANVLLLVLILPLFVNVFIRIKPTF